jgi:hypothetical protein
MAGTPGGALKVEIRSDPDLVVLRGTIIQHMGEAATDERWMKAVGMYVREIVMQRQFVQEGGYLGSGWQEIDDDYRDYKVRVHGADADYIGRRSNVLRDAMTNRDLSPITRDYTDLSGGGHTVLGLPVLEYDANTVVFGAETEEDGNSYAEHFDAKRPVMGEGKLPPEAEAEIGNVLKIRYLSAMRGVADIQADAASLAYLDSIDLGDLYQ